MKKQKLFIFGDSYADAYEWSDISSWTKLLKNNYEIENYGRVGSSLWWSYENFLKVLPTIENSSESVIVFVVTDSQRISNDALFVCNYGTCDFLLKMLKSESDFSGFSIWDKMFHGYDKKTISDILHAAKNYFLYLQNPSMYGFLQRKILAEIMKKCKNTKIKLVLIPAFQDSIPFQPIFKLCLSDITNKFFEINGSSEFHLIKEKNIMANHMNQTNNIILANKVHEIIQGTCTKITIDDFVFERVSNPEDYWDKQ